MNPETQHAFNTLRNPIANPNLQTSFDTQLHAFLNTDSNPKPHTTTAKSSSTLSRINRSVLALLRATQAIIKQRLQASVCKSRKRRPVPELIINLTTLEKTGAFQGLPLSFLDDQIGLHLVVLYIVVGRERFVWSVRIWCGQGQGSWVELALSMLRCLPACLKTRLSGLRAAQCP
jgi:hypothetical protein